MNSKPSRLTLIASARLRAKAELDARQTARDSLLGFTQYTKPDYRIGDMHRIIADALEEIERGENDRLMIFTPPRHGKSTLVSRHWPARYLGRFPTKQFIGASYGQALASEFGRDVRNIIASDEYRRVYPDVSLASDSAAKDRWHTNHGGIYVSAGVGSALTGKGGHVLSVDDPVKDRAEADSEIIRESVWNWFTSTAYTRLMPGGAVVLTMTRWHQDDLAGRLLANMANGGDQWKIINLQAIRDDGSALWPEAYPVAALRRIEASIGQRDWSALYMQDPRPLDGGLFKVALIQTMPGLPPDAPPAAFGPSWQQLAGVGNAAPVVPVRDGKPTLVRGWDLAATAQFGTNDPDWTVGVKLLRTPDDRFIVVDVVRLRGGPEDVRNAVLATAKADGTGCAIDLAQDPGQAGKAQIADFVRALAGYRVASSPETGDKATRAAPVASQVNVGNLSLLAAPWNAPLIEELRSFPSGSKDDQVDALSRAFNALTVTPAPSRRTNIPHMAR